MDLSEEYQRGLHKLDGEEAMKKKAETKDAYKYLEYCYNCGLKIYPGEWFSHSCVGNSHRFGCSFTARMFGAALNTLKFIILTPLMLIGIIIWPFIILKRVLSGEQCGGW